MRTDVHMEKFLATTRQQRGIKILEMIEVDILGNEIFLQYVPASRKATFDGWRLQSTHGGRKKLILYIKGELRYVARLGRITPEIEDNLVEHLKYRFSKDRKKRRNT